MKTPGTHWIIHMFALLHFAMAFLCRWADVQDEIWLTLVTITMVVTIGIKMRVRVELIVANLVLVNVAAYVIGTYGAKLIALISASDLIIYPAASFVTTEIIGWATYLFMKVTEKSSERRNPTSRHSDIRREHIVWLVAAISAVILIRVALTGLFSAWRHPGFSIVQIAWMLMSKSASVVVALCFIILTVRYIRLQCSGWSTMAKSFATALSLTLTAAAMIFFVNLSPGRSDVPQLSWSVQTFVVAIVVAVILYASVYLIDYALAARAAMYEERAKALNAQLQYAMLRQQVNPHFLFNSLNILDCMVKDGEEAAASEYIHKLAGIYRYMLRNDSETVTLRDEMTFVGLYTDLLKERFQDGFEVVTDIAPECLDKYVVPCSVQILIENAFKHNQVGGDSLLSVRITSEDGSGLKVSNNLRPKLKIGESTKVGLNYLKRQYKDLSGEDISVQDGPEEFIVTIPLLTR